MKLLVSLADCFSRAPDGHVYVGGPHQYSFWTRYLQVFDEVVVLARVRRVDDVPPRWGRADGDGVSFRDLPSYTGPREYWTVRSEAKAIVREAVGEAHAFLLRSGGGAVGAMAWQAIRRRGRPYGVEVTGDPWDALGPGTYAGWFRPIGRRLYTRNLRRICRHAAAAAYVTEGALQRRYPTTPEAFATHYSSVEMPAAAYVDAPRQFSPGANRLILIGNLQQFYKGPDLLVQAVALCAKRGVSVRLRILGDGRQRADLEEMIRSLGVGDFVHLVGRVAQRADVTRALDAADLFVLPSRQEGLPRAMIEAMGRGLPCISSTVGGMPELLPAEDMVPPNDAPALAEKIMEVLADPERMTHMSTRNLRIAAMYRTDILAPRREAMYKHLRAVSVGSA